MAQPDPALIDSALAAVGAEQLREVVRWALSELEDEACARTAERLFEWARTCGWSPAGPPPRAVAEAVAFAEAAANVGYADPHDVDAYLREGQNAFHNRDYPAARTIFGSLLPPVGRLEIDLGQHEQIDEVLYVDTALCAAQHVVATYMTTPSHQRAQGMFEAIVAVDEVGQFLDPLREMERVAVEPLPELEALLPAWRALVAERLADDLCPGTDEDRWLREVTRRLDGVQGLGELARSTRQSADLRAWCDALADAGDWETALSACEEAAEIVAPDWDDDRPSATFLDGAALAAQELGRRDLATRLEQAWRDTSTLLRLRRWLGSARTRPTLRKRAKAALGSVSESAHRQRALLHLLLGGYPEAAQLLSAAPGLGWSESDHPGHLVFPILQALLDGEAVPRPLLDPMRHWIDADTALELVGERRTPTLAAPEIADLLQLAGAGKALPAATRDLLLEALKRAAESRTAGVASKQRRRHYEHAAELVAACAALDPGPETDAWVAELRTTYRRFSSLQRELTAHLSPR